MFIFYIYVAKLCYVIMNDLSSFLILMLPQKLQTFSCCIFSTNEKLCMSINSLFTSSQNKTKSYLIITEYCSQNLIWQTCIQRWDVLFPLMFWCSLQNSTFRIYFWEGRRVILSLDATWGNRFMNLLSQFRLSQKAALSSCWSLLMSLHNVDFSMDILQSWREQNCKNDMNHTSCY